MINPTAAIIDEVENYLSRFIVHPHREAKYAHVLWILHTHLMNEWETTPRLAFLSPEPGSGKTRALEITALLVPNAVESANQTAAYIARKVSNQSNRPTLLLDEVDAIFSDTRTVNEDLRAVLNAGYRKGAKVGKCLQTPNGNFIANDLYIYCAVVLASLNVIPNTLADRSIIIAMKKRSAKERVESYRVKKEEEVARALRGKIQGWAKTLEPIGQIEPDLPELISDRQADIWEPLIIIADLAGQEFGARARESAMKIIMESRKKKPTLGYTNLIKLFWIRFFQTRIFSFQSQ